MNPNATVNSNTPAADVRSSHSRFQYKKVLDGRKQPIRGLWERNGKYIARIAVEDSDGMKRTHWVPLVGAETVPQAQEKLKALHVDRTRNALLWGLSSERGVLVHNFFGLGVMVRFGAFPLQGWSGASAGRPAIRTCRKQCL
ncbi:MAG: hypothetical protein ACLQU4_08600, partial [Limisphaerales bacterium]